MHPCHYAKWDTFRPMSLSFVKKGNLRFANGVLEREKVAKSFSFNKAPKQEMLDFLFAPIFQKANMAKIMK